MEWKLGFDFIIDRPASIMQRAKIKLNGNKKRQGISRPSGSGVERYYIPWRDTTEISCWPHDRARCWQFGSEASGLNVRTYVRSRRSNVMERIGTAWYRSNADDERGRDR